jgi:hypothetical protein
MHSLNHVVMQVQAKAVHLMPVTNNSQDQNIGDDTMVENMLGESSKPGTQDTMDEYTNSLLAEIDCLPPFEQEEDRMLAAQSIWKIVQTARAVAPPGFPLSKPLMLAEQWIKSGSDVWSGLSKLEQLINISEGKRRALLSTSHNAASARGSTSDYSPSSSDFTLSNIKHAEVSTQPQSNFVDMGVKSTAVPQRKAKSRGQTQKVARGPRVGKATLKQRMRNTPRLSTGGVAQVIDLSFIGDTGDDASRS